MNIQDEVQKIHHQFGVSEKANYEIQLMCERYAKEAIDTVVKELEKPLPTDDEIEAYALENILGADSREAFIRIGYWQTGAKWMRNLRGEATV